MATGTDILSLARAALEGDPIRTTTACRVIAANERDGSSLREGMQRLLEQANRRGARPGEFVPVDIRGLLLHVEPAHALDDVVIPQAITADLSCFLQERQYSDKIRDAGLPVPNRLLLSGPPGNGKTTLAGAIANALDLPFLVLDFSTIISSHLGETGAKLAKAFRGLAGVPCVLFVDEMETVMTERAGTGGKTDVGEVARIVSSLLLEIDRLPDRVVLIGATNHLEMLDRAVVRRFDHHWELPMPTEVIRQQWLDRFAKRHPNIPVNSFDFDTEELSLSDLERITHQHSRRWIVGLANNAVTA